jgi:hypothetical protein
MSGVVDPLLDRDQAVEVDPRCRCAPVAALDPVPPQLVELQASLLQQVDAVGRDAELQDLVGAAGVGEVRAAEVGERPVRALQIRGIGTDPEVMCFVYLGLAWSMNASPPMIRYRIP